VGGVAAAKNEFPWIVTLNFRESGSSYFCGGYIISSSWVLTAGHCCQATSSTYTITAGVYDLTVTTGTQSKGAAQVIPHPNYSSQTMYNDLCLIRVASPFDISGPSVRPIGLASPNQQTDGVLCTVSGWGLTSGSASDQPNILRKVQITGIPNADCRLTKIDDTKLNKTGVSPVDRWPWDEGRAYTLAPSQICSGGSGKSSCFGDSGGPYMCTSPSSSNLLGVGIVSGGASCGGEGIYTRVSSYLSWIQQVAGVSSGN